MFASRSAHSSLLARLSAMSCQALFAITLLTQVGCQGRYERGQEAIAEQRFDDAKNDARLGKQEAPNDPRYDLLMAEALVKEAYAMTQKLAEGPNQPPLERKKVQRRYKNALPHAQAALDSGQIDAEAGRLLGKIHWELDDPIEAVKVWRKARAADPDSIREADYLKALRTALGRVVLFEDHVQSLEFRTELEAFVKDNPSLIKSLPPETNQSLNENLSKESFRKNREAVAVLYGDSNRIDEALTLYDQLATDFPEESRYHYERGSLMLRTGKEKEAIEAFERYAKHPDPNEHGERLNDVASRAESLGVRSVSLHFYKKTLAHQPNTPSLERANTFIKLIELYLSLADDELARAAIADYFKEIKALQGNVDATKYLTIHTKARTQQREAIAIEVLEEGIANSPPKLKLTEQLAETYAQQSQFGQVERVMKLYVERVQQTKPDDHKLAMKQAANWATRRNNYDLALFFYTRMLEQDPDDPDTLLKSADLYALQGKRDEMRQRLEQYLSVTKRETPAVKNAARIYRKQRMFSEAEELLKLLIKREPGQLLYANNLAELYKDWGKVELIPKSYTTYLKSRDRRASELVAVAQRLRQYSYEDQAIPYLEEAADKGEPSALLTLADIYRFKRREAEMKRVLERYLELAPKRLNALEQVQSRYSAANLDNEAIAVLEEIIALNPSRRESYQEKLSNLYFKQGRQREAFDLWKDYITSTKNPSAPLKKMFNQFEKRKRYDWLLTFYQQLLEQGFEDDEIYKYIARTFHELSAESNNALYRDKAEQAYGLYFDRAKLQGRELNSFARDMMKGGFLKLSKQAHEQYISDNASRKRGVEASVYERYAILLFLLKDYDAGTATLNQFIEKSSNKIEAYNKAADLLISAGLEKDAEPYLIKILESSKTNKRKSAFQRLVNIYYESGQRNKIAPLVTSYLDNSINRSTDRDLVIDTVAKYGDRELMLTQLERQMISTDRSKSFQIGMLYWQMDERQEAERVWENWLSTANTTDSIEALRKLTGFYMSQGELEKATDYVQKITTLASGQELGQAHNQHALLLLSTSQFEAAMQAHEKAVEASDKSNAYETPQLIMTFFLKVQELQRPEWTRAVAHQALKYPGIDLAMYQMELAKKDLASGDVVRAERVIQQLKTSSIPLEQRINLLLRYNYTDQALSIIEDELISGDYITASTQIITNMPQLIETQGIEEIVRLIQPMLDRPRPTRWLEEQLGTALLNEGFLEQGTTLLKVAFDHRRANARDASESASVGISLTYAYLLIGETGSAHRLIIDLLSSLHRSKHEELLHSFAHLYLLTNRAQDFVEVLAHLAQDERFAESTLPMLILALCNQGDTLDAISTLRAIATPADVDQAAYLFSMDQDRAEAGVAFLSGVAALGGQGYVIEALDLLLTSPDSIKALPGYHALRARLIISQERGTTDELLEMTRLAIDTPSPLVKSGEAQTASQATPAAEVEAQLRLARRMLDMGRVDDAATLATPHLESTTHEHATRAFELLLGAWLIDPDSTSSPRKLTNTYMQASFNSLKASTEAIALLGKIGQDDIAMKIAMSRAQDYPTTDHIGSAMNYAALMGDEKEFAKQLDRFWLTSENVQYNVEANRLLALEMGHSYTFLEPMIDKLEALNPTGAGVPILRILLLIKAGDTSKARQVMLDLLERTEYSTEIIDSLLYQLSARELSVEVARVIAPKLTPDKMSTMTHLYLGLAHADIHYNEEARTHLDYYLRAHPSEGLAATHIAEQLLARDRPDMALLYANVAVKKAPELPTSFYWRGIAHLIEGKSSEAQEDIDRAMKMGFGRLNALPHVIQVALEHEQVELAKIYTEHYARAPELNANMPPSMMFVNAVSIWSESSHAKEGLTFLEETFPDLMTNLSLSPMLLIPMTGLYESAGSPEQTFALYEGVTRRTFITEPMESLSLSLNNLAYSRSTSKLGLDQAQELSRRSIAIAPGLIRVQDPSIDVRRRSNNDHLANTAPGRSASYLDTLGWISFQKGDVQEAERLIVQALNALTSQDASAVELYEHLADIREAQDRHAEATWIRIYISTMKGSRNLPFPPR